MKKILTALILAGCVSLPSMAQEVTDSNIAVQDTTATNTTDVNSTNDLANTSTNDNTSSASATNLNAVDTTAAQRQDQGQVQVQGQGNDQSITFNSTAPDKVRQEVNYSGSYKVKNTPNVSLGGPASGPCNGFSGGLGFSGPGFSFGANTSTVDKGCSLRELARVSAMIGRMDISNKAVEQAAAELGLSVASSEVSPPAPVSSAVPTILQPQSFNEKDVMKAQKAASQEVVNRAKAMNKINSELRFETVNTQTDSNRDRLTQLTQ